MILISIHVISNTPISYFVILFTIDVLIQFVNLLFMLIIMLKLNKFYKKKTEVTKNGIDDLIDNAFQSDHQTTTFRCDTSENNEKLNNHSTMSSNLKFDSEIKQKEMSANKLTLISKSYENQ